MATTIIIALVNDCCVPEPDAIPQHSIYAFLFFSVPDTA